MTMKKDILIVKIFSRVMNEKLARVKDRAAKEMGNISF